MSAREKVFARTAAQIRPLAEGRGSCFATDEITVKGRRVGYAYREAPDVKLDSGWRFTAGDESDEYMENPDNLGLYDVNTIANYDPEIIPLLGASVGTAYVRDPETAGFVRVDEREGEGEEDEGEPFPTVEGVHELTATWAITLPPGKFKRRLEDGSLVLWRPGLTTWINVWGNDRSETAEKRLRDIREQRAPAAFDLLGERVGELLVYGYRLAEPGDDGRVPGLYVFVVGRGGHVQMAVYFDDEGDLAAAHAMWRGVRER